ncbi:UNVERIFIED_CONTAM: hypothetical protein FKN15_017477 [Acipenser sinensis]
MPIKVGEKLPSVEVYEGDPGTKLSMADLFKGKKGILFAVPGAFTPGCSKVGEKLPSVEVYEGDPGTKLSMADLFKGKKGILFAVPGAFTPGCSKAAEMKAKGIQEIACVSVNDVFVMSAWGKEHAAEGKVRMLADPTGAFTQPPCLWCVFITEMGIRLLSHSSVIQSRFYCYQLDQPPVFLANKLRYAMLVQDGVVKKLNVEPDGHGLTCSLSSSMLSLVRTFEPLVEGGCELSAPYLEVNSDSHDALGQYLRLLDGVFLNRVLRLIDPNPKAERVYRNERSDEVLRVQNLSILTRHLRQYYQVCE